MDVDNDLDSQLMQQFRSMGTTDREVLITEFQKLLGNHLNPSCCAFFLDMNNWNLEAAICSYYDYEQPNIKVPAMAFVKDITIGEGESVPPATNFVKTWRIQNIGEENWPPGCSLKFVGGEQFGHRDRVMVGPLVPGEMTDVSIEMVSPSSQGIFQGQWRMCTATGLFFGENIWVILQVEDCGLLGVTQQLSSFGGELSHQSPPIFADNPFASPNKLDASAAPRLYEGSPSLSIIAQAGSAPSSPLTVDNSSSSNLPLPNARTALFQGVEESRAAQIAVYQQGGAVSSDAHSSEEMDSADMS